MDRPINRIQPAFDVQAYQTYSIKRRPDLLVRAACEQVGCSNWRLGWETHLDESTEDGKLRARYIRHQSGRAFREMRSASGLTVFRFEPGQRCFAEHKTNPEQYAVRGGDWRGNPTGWARQHQRPADWVEDFGEHQLRIVEQQKKG